ncbi:MAG: hypothetical protein IMX00_07630 [Limnochordales bacterium]|nr:hypothetical protein [Limnochordales bacterium]
MSRSGGEHSHDPAQDDDIQRLELHDIPFATPHICRICGGRITGSYLAEIHFGGVVTFRCLSHPGGLGPTIREGKDVLEKDQGSSLPRKWPQQGREAQPAIPSSPPLLAGEKSTG